MCRPVFVTSKKTSTAGEVAGGNVIMLTQSIHPCVLPPYATFLFLPFQFSFLFLYLVFTSFHLLRFRSDLIFFKIELGVM